MQVELLVEEESGGFMAEIAELPWCCAWSRQVQEAVREAFLLSAQQILEDIQYKERGPEDLKDLVEALLSGRYNEYLPKHKAVALADEISKMGESE